MAQDGFSSFIAAQPVRHAFEPLRRLIQRATQPYRNTSQGRIYLGEGQPVMVFPSYRGGPETTAALRRVLRDAGFASYDWGLGTDMGPGPQGLNDRLHRLEEQVIDLFEAERRPITLVGWGLSGIYARELAKRITPLIRQVITLSTPFNALSIPSNVPDTPFNAQAGKRKCSMLAALKDPHGRINPAVLLRLRQRPPVPCTSLYSMSDDNVPWEMCIEAESVTSENIEVDTATYLKLAMHPMVLEILTHRLAQPQEEWRPFNA